MQCCVERASVAVAALLCRRSCRRATSLEALAGGCACAMENGLCGSMPACRAGWLPQIGANRLGGAAAAAAGGGRQAGIEDFRSTYWGDLTQRRSKL